MGRDGKTPIIHGIHTVSFSHGFRLSICDQGGCTSQFAAVEVKREPSVLAQVTWSVCTCSCMSQMSHGLHRVEDALVMARFCPALVA